MKLSFYIFYLFIIVAVCPTYGQVISRIDSMKAVLPSQKGISKIKTLDELAWSLRFKKDSTGIKYAFESLKLSRNEASYIYETSALNILGKIAKEQEKFEDAEKYLNEALEISKKYDYEHGVARGYNELGFFYKKSERNIEAIEAFLYSHELFDDIGNSKAALKAITNLAKLYKDIEAYPEALKYYLKGLEFGQKYNDTKGLAIIYRDLGTLSKYQENYTEMLEYSLKSKELFEKLKMHNDIFNVNIQIAESYYYLDQEEISKQIYLETLEMVSTFNIKDASNLYHNFAALYNELGNKDSALFYYKKAEKIYKANSDYKRLSKTYNNLGSLYLDVDSLNKAFKNFSNSLALQKQVKDSSLLQKTYYSLSEFYEKNNDFKTAFAYQDSSSLVKEKFYNSIKKADRYDVKYINEKRKLAVVEKEETISKYSIQQKNTQIIILVILLVVALILFFVLLRVKKLKQQKKLAELAVEQQKIEAQLAKEQQEKKLEEMLKAQERKAITSMITGQEEERERIAKDLHDRLGSMLSVVKIHYKSVEEDLEKIKNETKSQYEKANELLDEACETVRKIAHNMVSGTLTKFGLVPALKELKQKIEETKMLQIELVAHGLDNRLDNTTEIQLYRIIQELLNNTLKHANATEVTIQLLKREVDLNIMITDNGDGFDVNNDVYEGMGLKSIKARVAEMSGNVLIDSSKGNGTTVTIEIPTTK